MINAHDQKQSLTQINEHHWLRPRRSRAEIVRQPKHVSRPMVNPVFQHVHGVRGLDVFVIHDIASGVRARDHSGLGAREVVVVDVSGAVSVLMVPAKALSAVGSHSEASFRGTSGIDSTDAKSVGTTMSSHTPVLSRIVGLVDLWGGSDPLRSELSNISSGCSASSGRQRVKSQVQMTSFSTRVQID